MCRIYSGAKGVQLPETKRATSVGERSVNRLPSMFP
jgi:hypothetical protein